MENLAWFKYEFAEQKENRKKYLTDIIFCQEIKYDNDMI